MSKKKRIPNQAATNRAAHPAATTATAANHATATEPSTEHAAATEQTSQESVVAALLATLDAVTELAESRARRHLSTLRLKGVARELRELLKVVSVYSL